MSIRATREGLYWLLCDINAYVSTALDAYRAGDMEALGTELKGCAEYVRNEIDDMGAETPDIENSEDPRDVADLVRRLNADPSAIRQFTDFDPAKDPGPTTESD